MLKVPTAGLFPQVTYAVVCLAGLLALSGCATSKPAKTPDSVIPPATPQAHGESAISPPITVLRSGRYTLIELLPDASQRDLMQQMVDLSFPSPVTTVGEALRYLLLHTGYRLCDTAPVKETFDAWPLPAAHLHLGPLTLRQAIELLAGAAWTPQVDENTRQVCFAGGAS